MSKLDKQLIGQVDAEQIKFWKEKHQEVHQIMVKGHVCYLRNIDRKTLAYAMSLIGIKVSKDNAAEINLGRIIQMGEAALTNCWIGGSEEIKKNDKYWLAAALAAGELVDFEEAEIKKL